MQGDCQRPPTTEDLAVLANTPEAVQLLPLQPGQCIMMSYEDLLPVLSPKCAPAHSPFHQLWLRVGRLSALWHGSGTQRTE